MIQLFITIFLIRFLQTFCLIDLDQNKTAFYKFLQQILIEYISIDLNQST